MSTTDAEVVRTAAELIRRQGHCKGAAVDRQGRLCLMGALAAAITDLYMTSSGVFTPRSRDAVKEAAAAVIAAQFPERYVISSRAGVATVKFNDHPDTTAEEVIAVLEKAAAGLEGSMA